MIPGTDAQDVAPFGILLQGLACGGFEWNEARFSELRLSNRENPVIEIHVGPVERQRFTRAETRRRKQPDKGRVR